jgi:hypothetical protein
MRIVSGIGSVSTDLMNVASSVRDHLGNLATKTHVKEAAFWFFAATTVNAYSEYILARPVLNSKAFSLFLPIARVGSAVTIVAGRQQERPDISLMGVSALLLTMAPQFLEQQQKACLVPVYSDLLCKSAASTHTALLIVAIGTALLATAILVRKTLADFRT